MKNKPRKLPLNLFLAALLTIALFSSALGLLGVISLSIVGFLLIGLASISALALIVGSVQRLRSSGQQERYTSLLHNQESRSTYPSIPETQSEKIDAILEKIKDKYSTVELAYNRLKNIIANDNLATEEEIIKIMQMHPILFTNKYDEPGFAGTGQTILEYACICFTMPYITDAGKSEKVIKAILQAGGYSEAAHNQVREHVRLNGLFNECKAQAVLSIKSV